MIVQAVQKLDILVTVQDMCVRAILQSTNIPMIVHTTILMHTALWFNNHAIDMRVRKIIMAI